MTDLSADYDEGYFDKDEQGWCARRVRLTSDGSRVSIRRSGDDNGQRAYDDTVEGTLGPAWPELGLIQIVGERGPLAYFDARTRRVRWPGEQVVHQFVPPPGFGDERCLEVGLGLVVPVAAALGMRPGPPPKHIVMPPLTASPYAANARECTHTITGEQGHRWVFMLRAYPAGDPLGPQFDVRVEGEGTWVSVFAGESRRGLFMFIGPLERHHLAAAERDRLLALWGARPPGA